MSTKTKKNQLIGKGKGMKQRLLNMGYFDEI